MDHTILVIDDEKDIRVALAGILEDEGYQVLSAASGAEGIEAALQELPDLILLDIWMPGMDGLEVLSRLKELLPQATVIMISGHGTIETAVKATKLGAFDFIEKPLSLEKILLSVSNALKIRVLLEENAELKKSVYNDSDLLGEAPGIVALKEQIRLVADTAVSLLLNGENGSGRHLAAYSIHNNSQRRQRPFVAVNCAGIPEGLMECELFGNEKGAFTGATSQRKGRFDAAQGGTIYLDEVSELSPTLQSSLSKLLQEKSFVRVGGSRQIATDARIIASSSVRLEDSVAEGRFNSTLYYQLSTVKLEIPPLRQRVGDIAALVQHFAACFYKREGGGAKQFLPEAIEKLQSYGWPGNLRELKNVVERLLILTPGRQVAAYDVARSLGISEAQADPSPVRTDDLFERALLRDARENFEREFIIRKLAENDWNISKTADLMDLERSNLHRKIKSYGIQCRL